MVLVGLIVLIKNVCLGAVEKGDYIWVIKVDKVIKIWELRR